MEKHSFLTPPELCGMIILDDNSAQAERCRDDLNPVDSNWLGARQLSQRPQLVVLGNYVAGGVP